MPSAAINGTTLFYSVVGEGLPCLVMHGGLGLDHHYLHPSLDPLGDTLQLIYYDHRGNGSSGRPGRATLTHAQLADDAAALATHLGHERIAVLGFSYGGFIALEFALRHPDRLSHLLLMGTAPAYGYGDDILAHARRKGATPAMLAYLESDDEVADDAAFKEQIETLWPLYFHDHRPEHDRLLDGVIYSIDGFAAPGETDAYDVRPRLGEIAAPTLILAGRDDFVCPPSQAEMMHAGIPDSELRIFEHSGHMPYAEEPDATFGTIRDWVARHR